MKFIPSRDLRIRPGKVWRDLKKDKEIIVTSNGQPVAMVVPVSGETVEETVRDWRQLRAMAALRRIREAVRKSGVRWTMKQIDEVIQKVRKARRK